MTTAESVDRHQIARRTVVIDVEVNALPGWARDRLDTFATGGQHPDPSAGFFS